MLFDLLISQLLTIETPSVGSQIDMKAGQAAMFVISFRWETQQVTMLCDKTGERLWYITWPYYWDDYGDPCWCYRVRVLLQNSPLAKRLQYGL